MPARRSSLSVALVRRVVIDAVRPPAITNVALPSLRSWRSWRTFERRFACENVVSVPRQRVSVAGQVIDTTIVPRVERGLLSVGCGAVLSVTEEPVVVVLELEPLVGSGTTASSSAM